MLAGGDKDAQKMALQAATRPTTVSPMPPTTPTTPSFGGAPLGGNSMSVTPSFTPAAAPFTPQVATGFGGKPMPVQPPQPEL